MNISPETLKLMCAIGRAVVEISFLLVVIKSFLIGSDFSFLNYFKYRKDYWDWYKNRETYADFIKEWSVFRTRDIIEDSLEFKMKHELTPIPYWELLVRYKDIPDLVKFHRVHMWWNYKPDAIDINQLKREFVDALVFYERRKIWK